MSSSPSARLWGLLTRQERWGLSWRGRLIAALLVVAVGWALLAGIFPFLAVTHRVDTRVLVVEGWVHPYAITAAVEEFRTGAYQRIITTGGPVSGTGGYTNDYNTSASVAAGRLKTAGVASEFVQMAPSRVMDRDRTFSSAVALRDWLRAHGVFVQSFNLVTEDVHARRSRLLFQKAFGDGVTVGIIAVPNPDYDPRHWWRYSEGVRDVIDETLAYLYARFLFWPSV